MFDSTGIILHDDYLAKLELKTIKIRTLKMPKKIKPSDLESEAQRLIAEQKMPSLEQLLDAIAETREEYRPLILAARRESNGTNPE